MTSLRTRRARPTALGASVYRVIACLETQHDYRLVLLAALVCAAAAVASLRIYSHALKSSGLQQLVLLLLTGVSTGAGIWATHFIAMLAYEPGIPAAYDMASTTASLLVAVAATTAGFAICGNSTGRLRAAGGGVIGAGIALMHYTGMAALIVPGTLEWSAGHVVASVAIGIALSAAAIVTFHRSNDRQAIWVGAGMLALAVCSLHFTAMSAVTIAPDPRIVVSPSQIGPSTMAIAVTGAALLIMLSAVTATAIMENQTRRRINLELEKSHALLNERSRCLQTIVHNFPGGITLLDAGHRVTVTNDTARKLLDLPDQIFADGPPLLEDIFRFNAGRGEYGPGDAEEQINDRMALVRTGQAHLLERERPDGTVIEIRGVPLPDGGFVTIYMDITERKRSDAQIAHMARHDALTDLANRALLNQQLEDALAHVKRGQMAAVHFIDLDHFKGVNDTLGHPAGDALLQAAAGRLASLVRTTDTIARLGGDEFAILQMPIANAAEATALAKRTIATLGAPYELEGRPVSVGASVGIAMAPADGVVADDLMRNADLALYHAKRDGRGQYRSFEQVSEQIRERQQLLCDLRTAIAAGQFEVHYQPMIDIETRRKVAMEALVRWRHPLRGMIPPDRFIPLAEETGLIELLGEQVLRQACLDATQWSPFTKVSVNVSPVQFQSGDLTSKIVRILAETGLPPQRLELEITETLLLEGTEQNFAILHQLRSLGVTIALDDFGTGYSSLSYLHAFPLDKIKIDRSFVREIAGRDECAAIVCAVANLGRSLGTITVAEGVETESQLDLVRAAGVTQAQGFLFGRPCPVAELDFGDHVARPPADENAGVTAKDVMLVRASFGRLLPHPDGVADPFYDRLFATAPDLRRLFPGDLGDQKRKLMTMLATAIGKLHELESLLPVLTDLGARHVAYGTKAEHYVVVADALLWALEKRLGDSFTTEVKAAWVKVYTTLAVAMQAGAAQATIQRPEGRPRRKLGRR
jgi:diguanylate cyclase (GGDEF)-like protein